MNIFPYSMFTYKANKSDGHSVHFGKNVRTRAKVECMSNFANVAFRKLGVGIVFSSIVSESVSVGMKHICLMCDIFKIVMAAVAFITVDVIHLFIRRAWPSERLYYKRVNLPCFSLSLVVKVYDAISIPCLKWEKKSLGVSPSMYDATVFPPPNPSDVSKVGDLIETFMANDRLPDFSCVRIMFRHVTLLVRLMCQEPPVRSSALCGSIIVA